MRRWAPWRRCWLAARGGQVRPDGGVIAYVRQTTDIMTDKARPAIWLVDPATGAQTPLASEPGGPDATSPRWSPDGKRLAFVAFREGGRRAGGATPPGRRWSPDGKRLAFVAFREGGRPELYVRWMETGQVAKVAT